MNKDKILQEWSILKIFLAFYWITIAHAFKFLKNKIQILTQTKNCNRFYRGVKQFLANFIDFLGELDRIFKKILIIYDGYENIKKLFTNILKFA